MDYDILLSIAMLLGLTAALYSSKPFSLEPAAASATDAFCFNSFGFDSCLLTTGLTFCSEFLAPDGCYGGLAFFLLLNNICCCWSAMAELLFIYGGC